MHDHISEPLMSLHWLRIKYRIIFKIALLTYKCLHNTAPDYLKKHIITKHTTYNSRSSNKNFLLVPRVKTHFGERSFSYASPHIWNSIPIKIRNSETQNIFKIKLKTYLFELDYNRVIGDKK